MKTAILFSAAIIASTMVICSAFPPAPLNQHFLRLFGGYHPLEPERDAFSSGSYEWKPALPSDKRSPCPALNTLANHGYINRNGLSISAKELIEAMHAVFNLDRYVGSLLANAAINVLSPESKLLDLDQLRKHGFIEHDASLTRNDTNLPGSNNNMEVVPKLVQQLILFSDSNYQLNMKGLVAARHLREQQCARDNSEYTFGWKERITAYAEAGLLWEYLHDPNTKSINTAKLKMFLLEERIPAGHKNEPISLLKILRSAVKMIFM